MTSRKICFAGALVLFATSALSPSKVMPSHERSNRMSDQEPRTVIRMNQHAFGANWPKAGYVRMSKPRQKVQISALDRSDAVVEADLMATGTANLYRFDFSSLHSPGDYVVRVGQDSSAFSIRQAPNAELELLLLHALDLQRCGVQVTDSRGVVIHQACHLGDAAIESVGTGTHLNVTGGWHDAGDYGKYVATAAPTAVRLLDIVEWMDWCSRSTSWDLSVSREAILRSAKVGVDWLLRTQNPEGAVFRKVSGRSWPGEILPERDTQPRFAFGISTEETGKFAGTMAMAARIWRKSDPEFSRRCREAAIRAWEYLGKHSYRVDKGPHDDEGSGAYPSRVYDAEWTCYTDADDRLWAGIELYLTTQDANYLSGFGDQIERKQVTPFEWKDMSTQAIVDYYFLGAGVSERARDFIREKLVKRADELVRRSQSNAYGITVNTYKWGSNKYVAEDGILLLWTYRITANKSYFDTAVTLLNYLLGQNELGKSFITGVGTNPPQHPHHRLMRALGTTFPGFLVGGPTDVAPSGAMGPGLGALGYADSALSYESNEPAIDYNASMLFFLMLLDDLGRRRSH